MFPAPVFLRPLAVAAALTLPAAAAAQEAPLRVLATVAMIADVAANVAGDCAAVTALLPAGSDPHLHQPTPADVRALAEAELIFYVDPALEGRLAGVLRDFAARTPTVAVARAALGAAELIGDPDDAAMIDPHLWMDVSRWARIAPVIAGAIAEQRPGCADAMAANVADYGAQLAALHDWVGRSIASIPQGQRKLITAHDAFSYYADAYGIDASEAIGGLSTEAEASIADIRAVAAFVAESGVPAVFVETTVNPRTVEALVAEVRALGGQVRIGGALFSDAMGAAGEPGDTYIGMIWENTVTIVNALGGSVAQVPEALHGWARDRDIPH